MQGIKNLTVNEGFSIIELPLKQQNNSSLTIRQTQEAPTEPKEFISFL